jgi:hypothetical protein
MNGRNLPHMSRSHEMAATLLRGHAEASLDLDDECLIDDWLRAAMYTDDQICLYRRAALDCARARLARGQDEPSADVTDGNTVLAEFADC